MESLVLEDFDFYTPSTMPSQAQTSTSYQSSRDDMQHFTMSTPMIQSRQPARTDCD